MLQISFVQFIKQVLNCSESIAENTLFKVSVEGILFLYEPCFFNQVI